MNMGWYFLFFLNLFAGTLNAFVFVFGDGQWFNVLFGVMNFAVASRIRTEYLQ